MAHAHYINLEDNKSIDEMISTLNRLYVYAGGRNAGRNAVRNIFGQNTIDTEDAEFEVVSSVVNGKSCMQHGVEMEEESLKLFNHTKLLTNGGII